MEEYNTKICSKCKERKDMHSFNKCTARKDGLHNYCRQCSSISYKSWRSNNKDRARDNFKKWAAKNALKRREYGVAYRKSHAEQRQQLMRQWKRNNPNKNRIYKSARRAKIKGAGGSYSKRDLERQYNIQNGKCWWNTEHELGANYHVDHLVPLARGGHNWPSNIVLACPACNQSKNDKMPHEWAGRLL